MTDSNGRNSNDPRNPMGIGTTTTTSPGAASGAGTANVSGAATAPKPRRAAPVKTAPTSAGPSARPSSSTARASAKTTVRDEATKLKDEASGKARDIANQGKAKAVSALDNFAGMMTDAAAEVDERMGEQYGRYARNAADGISNLSATLRRKEVDELLGDARDLVRKSPAIAIGAAAAVGFVLARLIKSGAALADDDEAGRETRRSNIDDVPSV